jgi:hypothetical protein
LINNAAKANYDPQKPWPWVSYEDRAWIDEPWEVADDSDIAEAGVRLVVRMLMSVLGSHSALEAASLVEKAAGDVLADVVAEARTQTYSWGRLGEALGVTRTAAQKRFGKGTTDQRAAALEDQYQRLRWFVLSAEPGEYLSPEDLQAARDAARDCHRRRRGVHADPLDTLPKVVQRKRRRK